MTKDDITHGYFEWLCQFVYDGSNMPNDLSYRKLLYFLNSVDFTYRLPMDGNRYEEGIELRYRYGYENGIGDSVIAYYLDDRPCSVFEMMIALSIHLEEHIMDDPTIGNRCGQWFWNMIVNLGLHGMEDRKFNRREAEAIINRFLNREYKRNGEGGLFIIQDPTKDLRTAEIWYQACWYLNEVIYA